MSRGAWVALGVLVFAALIGVMTWHMLGMRQNPVEVCMAFNGLTNCSTASGITRDEAIRTATHAACTLIASGVTGSQACERGEPVSVKWLD